MYTSAVLNTVQRPFPLEPFSSLLNGCQTEKQLNSLFANENQCGFTNYVSRNSRAPLSLHFNTLLHSSAPSSSPPLTSFSVKVSRIPKSAFARTRYSAEPFAVKRETFTTLPTRRIPSVFSTPSVSPRLFSSLRSCCKQRDKAAFRFTRWN